MRCSPKRAQGCLTTSMSRFSRLSASPGCTDCVSWRSQKPSTMPVLGSTRRGRLGRLSHPSLSRGVLRDPPCAVTVVSHDPRDRARSAPGQPAKSAHGRQSGSGTLTRLTRELRRGGI
jgi:hypothetical protein